MPANPNSLLPADQYDLTDKDKNNFAYEATLGMAPPTDPILSRMAAYVPQRAIGTANLAAIITRLERAALGQRSVKKSDKPSRTLVGLAAPQIGESWRIILVDTRVRASRKSTGKLMCFINPETVWRSCETEEGREGCFSAGPVWGLVRRPVAVKIRAVTPTGEDVERIFEGFTARIVQHEMDHLDGVRFPDRIHSDRKRHWVHAEELAVYPKRIHRWKRICTRQRWEQYIT
jgi:peptide deformylase